MNVQLKRLAFPVLLIALVLMAQTTGWGQKSEGAQEQDRANQAKLALIKNIPVPEDRDAIAGTFELGGETIKVTAGEHYDTHVLLTQMEGNARRPLTAEEAWSYIMLTRWADALDLYATDAELNRAIQKKNPVLHKGLMRRWAAINVSPEAGEAYHRDMIRIGHLKNLLFDSNRATTKAAFDHFKLRKLQYQFDYICYDASQFVGELKKRGVTKETLEDFWKRDRGAAARYRLPASVSGAIVSFDPSKFTPEMVAKFGDASQVTDERALAYFKANKKRLIGSIPPDKRHLLTLKPGASLDQVVSPFSLVKDGIKKKLVLEHLIADAHKEAMTAGANADLKAIAKKFQLEHSEFVDMDRRQAMEKMQEFGIPAFTRLFSSPVGKIGPRIEIVGERRFFFFVKDKKSDRLPKLEEVMDKVKEFYFETKASELAREAAKELFDEMEAKLDEAIAPERAKLEAEAAKKAEAEIKQMNLQRDGDKQRAHARAKARIRLPLDLAKKAKRPMIFDEIVKRKNIKLTKSPYFEFSAQREDRSKIDDIEKSRAMFLAGSYQVRALDKGGVTGMILEDHLTRSYFLGKLSDKRDPAMDTMGPVDLIQARGQIRQISQARFPRQFQFSELQKNFNFKRGN